MRLTHDFKDLKPEYYWNDQVSDYAPTKPSINLEAEAVDELLVITNVFEKAWVAIIEALKESYAFNTPKTLECFKKVLQLEKNGLKMMETINKPHVIGYTLVTDTTTQAYTSR